MPVTEKDTTTNKSIAESVGTDNAIRDANGDADPSISGSDCGELL